MATLESQDGRVLVHRTAPGRYVAYVGLPPAGPLPTTGRQCGWSPATSRRTPPRWHRPSPPRSPATTAPT